MRNEAWHAAITLLKIRWDHFVCSPSTLIQTVIYMYPSTSNRTARGLKAYFRVPSPLRYTALDSTYVYRPLELRIPDRPRRARRQRLWHLFACTFLAVLALLLLLNSTFLRFLNRKLVSPSAV